MSFDKFELRYPSLQNAVEVFAGKWASDLSKACSVVNTGGADLFVGDPRPKMAAEALGNGDGRIDGMRVLELGPLEAAHSFQLEHLGASSVLGIEANAEAFLKCLVVKELLNLRNCHFMLGDVLEFTKNTKESFDIVFCSGILYHMQDPISLIKAICSITDKCFVWTHYYDADSGNKEGERKCRHVNYDGLITDYYELEYSNRQEDTFWGGNTDLRAWMPRDGILACFRHFGLDDVRILQDIPSHQNGASMSFVATRGKKIL